MKHLARLALRAIARLRRAAAHLQRPAEADPRLVGRLAETVAAEPTLRHWLLISASEPPRVRRALLARVAHTLRTEQKGAEAAEALEQLTEVRLLHAVIETLFRRHGLPPLPPQLRTGRTARVRLGELSEHLQADATLLALAA